MKAPVVLPIIALALLSGCGVETTSSFSSSSSESSVTSIDSSLSSSFGIALDKKYGVFDDSGTLLKQDDNVFSMVIYASKNSLTSNKLAVYAKDGSKIFRYGHAEIYYCFDGSSFVETVTSQGAADSFVKTHRNGHVINSEGNAYAAVGSTTDPASAYPAYGVELESGSYFYEFSKKAASFSDGIGMGYVSSVIEFSKFRCKYQTYSDEVGWNGYVFYNFLVDSPWNCCDMGLIQMDAQTPGQWIPVFNFNGTMINPGLEREQTMTYNEQDGYYYGNQDVLFEGWVDTAAYHMRFTNLVTGSVHEYAQANSALATLASKTYLLLAASWCPVTSGTALWNARCGGRFENLTFSDVHASKYLASGDYLSSEKKPFVPGGDYTNYGLIVSPDCCTVSHTDDSVSVSIVYDEQ